MDTDGLSGHLILIMAPSGSGKGVLIKQLLAAFPELHFAVSCTTREKREGEVHGREYYFLTRGAFLAEVENDAFVEWAEYGGNYYGTLKAEIVDNMRAGKVVVNEIELQGIRSLHALIPSEYRTTIYIDGGDWETLQSRITKRAPLSPEELELRKERYNEEVQAKEVADAVIENHEGKLDEAKQSLFQIVRDIISHVK